MLFRVGRKSLSKGLSGLLKRITDKDEKGSHKSKSSERDSGFSNSQLGFNTSQLVAAGSQFWIFFNGKLQSFALTNKITVGDVIDTLSAEDEGLLDEEKSPGSDDEAPSGDKTPTAPPPEPQDKLIALSVDEHELPANVRLSTIDPHYCIVARQSQSTFSITFFIPV
jgi:hypothetical protein